MKVWITKYALTDGIVEKEVYSKDSLYIIFTDGSYDFVKNEGKHWHINKDSAIKRAEEMRQKKIASLKKQIEKLEEMRFE